jgi:DNA repair ATPase RecN
MAMRVSTRLLSLWRSTIASGIRAARLNTSSKARSARTCELRTSFKELNEFNPQPGEFEQIDEEYKRLANSGHLLSTRMRSTCWRMAKT